MSFDFSQEGLKHFSRMADPVVGGPTSVDLIINRIDALAADFTQSEVNGLFVPLPLE